MFIWADPINDTNIRRITDDSLSICLVLVFEKYESKKNENSLKIQGVFKFTFAFAFYKTYF